MEFESDVLEIWIGAFEGVAADGVGRVEGWELEGVRYSGLVGIE